MSRETTGARFVAREADRAYKIHLYECSWCALADAGKRPWSDMCDRGAALRTDRAEANADLRRNRELDRQPAPDQAGLF